MKSSFEDRRQSCIQSCFLFRREKRRSMKNAFQESQLSLRSMLHILDASILYTSILDASILYTSILDVSILYTPILDTYILDTVEE